MDSAYLAPPAAAASAPPAQALVVVPPHVAAQRVPSTGGVLLRLRSGIGKHWRALGELLALDACYLDSIEVEAHTLSDRAGKVLTLVTGRRGSAFTVGVLVKALLELELHDVALKLVDEMNKQ